jgi:hypothetical protein
MGQSVIPRSWCVADEAQDRDVIVTLSDQHSEMRATMARSSAADTAERK